MANPVFLVISNAYNSKFIKQKCRATCSDASLYGVYSYATGGTKQVNNQWVKFLEIGVNYFDGQGNVLKAYTNSLNSKTETVKGTYGVLPNCQSEIKYETGEQFYFFTPPMGDKFYYTQSVITNTGSAETGWMERQSKGLEFACFDGDFERNVFLWRKRDQK